MTDIYVRDRTGDDGGEISDFSKLAAIVRLRDVGSWSIDLPLSGASRALSEPGAAIVIERNGEVISGPTKSIERSGTDSLTISGLTDDAVLWGTGVWPAKPNFSADMVFKDNAYDVIAGKCETVMRHYVGANCSTGSTFAHSRPAVELLADQGRGGDVIGRGRFQTLGELLATLAVGPGGNLGFGVSDLMFKVWEPVDRTAEIVFSEDMGNVFESSYSLFAPEATHVLVAGGGEGVARNFIMVSDEELAARWNRRIEVLVDRRDTSDLAELTQAGQQTLADKAEKVTLSVNPVDVPHMTYGVDYRLGDTATLVEDGTEIVGTVNQVQLTLDGSGETVKPVLDTTTTTAATVLKIFDRLRELSRRTASLERTL